MGRQNTKINEDARRRLNELKARVLSDFGVAARQEDIISALVMDATPGHITGVLLAYRKATAPPPPSEAPAASLE